MISDLTNEKERKQVKVFPNPVQHSFKVEKQWASEFEGDLYLKIYDLTGKLVYTDVLKSFYEAIEINMHGLNSGIYVLNITGKNGKNIDRKKIVKY